MIKNRNHIMLFSQTGKECLEIINHFKQFPAALVLHQNKRLKVCEELANTPGINRYTLPVKPTVSDYLKIFSRFDNPIISLHGYLRLIPKEISENFFLVNGHPGLVQYSIGGNLDIIKGLDAQETLWKNRENYQAVGSIVHQVIPETDSGRIESIDIRKNTAETKDEMYSLLRKTSLQSWIQFFENYDKRN